MYKGLPIATNKVTEEELRLVKHHLIDFLLPNQKWSVVDFRDKALPLMESMLARGTMPVICGGTNYYIESLLWKVLVSYNKDDDGQGQEEWSALSNEELHAKLKAVDPERADTLHPNDRRKVQNSLLVYWRTGVPHSQHLKEQREASDDGGIFGGGLRFPGRALVLWVKCDQAVLDDRCDRRVDQMLNRGLLEEIMDFHEVKK